MVSVIEGFHCILNMLRHVSASGVAVRGDSGVAGEGDLELLVYQSFIPGVNVPCH